jgi:hypothetical protein
MGTLPLFTTLFGIGILGINRGGAKSSITLDPPVWLYVPPFPKGSWEYMCPLKISFLTSLGMFRIGTCVCVCLC